MLFTHFGWFGAHDNKRCSLHNMKEESIQEKNRTERIKANGGKSFV